MPFEISAVVANTVVSSLLGPRLQDLSAAVRDRTRDTLAGGRLEGPLRRVYRDACDAFLTSLSAVNEGWAAVQVRDLMQDDAFLDALRQLPFVPLRDISTAVSREQFTALRLPGSQPDDFDEAWHALYKRFRRAAAQNEELHRLLEISLAEDRGDRLANLEELVRELINKLNVTPPDAPDIAAYREFLYQRYIYVDTRGLFIREKEGTGDGIRLRDVFVETPLERTTETFRSAKKRDGDDVIGGEKGGDDAVGRGRVGTETAPIRDVLCRERLTVVLGARGSGKSTLMRCLAMTLCRPGEAILDTGLGYGDDVPVPILFELKIFAAELRQNDRCRLDEFLVERIRHDLPPVEKLLHDGKVVVLLDGLDEVFDENDRRWVSDQVWELVHRYPRTRFVLTSRPHGYRAAPLPGPVTLWNLAAFDDDGIRAFFRGWFEALAHKCAEGGAHQGPQERADSLTDDVLGRPRIRTMARNPMLCTLIVLVHRWHSGHLPDRRVVFYKAAVKTLAESWERYKHSPRGVAEGYDFPVPQVMIHVLAEVAWRSFHELGEREIPGDKLRQWLGESLSALPEWTGKRGRKAIDDFLQVIQERTGLLLDLGGDRFQFVHLSLHEYLVAFYILDRLEEEQGCRVLLHYLHAPQWEEALRLMVAGAGQARASRMVRAILDNPTSEWENRLCRDLRFVCRCLGDNSNVTSEVRGDVHERLVEAFDGGRVFERNELAREAAGAGPGKMAVAMRQRIKDQNEFIRCDAVEYFNHLNLDDPENRTALKTRIDDWEDYTRSLAIEILARSDDNPDTRAVFEKKLKNEHGMARGAAIGFFSHLSTVVPKHRIAIEAGLEDKDPDVRMEAILFFSRRKIGDESIRAAMKRRIHDEHFNVRILAIRFFSAVGTVDPSVMTAIRGKLEDRAWSVRLAAIEFFHRLGIDENLDITNAVARRIYDGDSTVRRAAARFFSRVDIVDSRAAVLALRDDGENAPKIASSATLEFLARRAVNNTANRIFFEKELDNRKVGSCRAALEFFSRVGIPAAWPTGQRPRHGHDRPCLCTG